MRHTIVLIAVVALSIGACGGDVSDEAENPEAIYAAAAFHLATEANTFGPGHRFTEVLVVDRTVLDAAEPIATTPEGTAFTPAQRTAIRQALEPDSLVRFIESPEDFRTDDLRPTIEGAAIFTFAPILMVDDTTAHVGTSMWCGGACGLWATFVVELVDGAWTVTGTDGPVAIS